MRKQLFTYLIAVLCVLLIGACREPEYQPHKIYGNWKLRDLIQPEGSDIKLEDKIYFFADGTISGGVWVNGKPEYKMTATFKLDSATQTLTIVMADTIVTFGIKKLTDDEMELYDGGAKRITRYVRF